jgi:hypothetical protein
MFLITSFIEKIYQEVFSFCIYLYHSLKEFLTSFPDFLNAFFSEIRRIIASYIGQQIFSVQRILISKEQNVVGEIVTLKKALNDLLKQVYDLIKDFFDFW